MTFSVMNAQVSITLSVKPPFTPFISDYTNPERLKDISVALFNQSGNMLRLKFRLSLKNQAKGIDISIKETVNPLNPLILDENEFRFVVLEDVSNLYGRLDQNSFNITGADIQNLILDGTIPDGIYEVCLQAFDFDAPGFSKPLSDVAPQGCFTFQVNYTDPPTDIRFNNNLLQYSFGGEVPKVGVNSLMGQNYNIQFTPPAMNVDASYEYELMIFEETAINPSRQRESSILEGIETITPIIRKTSNVPFFTIDPGDVELDLFFKNYYMLIRATDLNGKTLFKNKGYSTFKAFKLVDIQPMAIPKAEFTNPTPGKIVGTREAMDIISWDVDMPTLSQAFFRKDIEARVKIIRLHQSAIIPDDVFNTNTGEVLLDRRFSHDTLSGASLLSAIRTTDKFGNFEANSNTRWVIGVEYKVIPGRPFTSQIVFLNNGRSQTDVEFQNDAQTTPLGNFMMTQSYPVNDDTLPFHYPPVVFALANTRTSDAALFTQFNSPLEPVESFKHLKLGTDPAVNTQMNTLTNSDTVLNDVNKSLNDAATAQLHHGSEIDISHYLNTAAAKLNQNNARFRIQIKHTINTRSVPLGNSANGKMAMLNSVLKYHAVTQFLTSEPNLSFPNMEQILYTKPFKNGVSWTAKVGLWNKSDNPGLSVDQFAFKFHTHSFSSEELMHPMLKKGLKTGSGKFNVGMKTPKLISTQVVKRDSASCTINLSFLPSEMPSKLLPDMETNEAWKEFNLMSVAQQWNLEISRRKDFKVLDTVISRKIVKQYDITKGSSAIIVDLYSRIDQQITVRDTGKYYWRVTWSNVTVDSTESADKRAYYGNLGRLLASAQLVGVDVNFDSMFFIRKNYKFSKIDSFSFNKNTRPSAVKTPAFEVVYPAPGDTIPFMYPPVVIRKNPADTAYKFALTTFNSTLEPFVNHNYFIIDDRHPASTRLKSISYDSMRGKFQQMYDKITQDQLLNGEDAASEHQPVINEFLQLTEKKDHLQIFQASGSNQLPLGSNGKGKLNLSAMIMSRQASWQQLTEETESPEEPNMAGMLYLQPFKKINWNARIAYFYPNGTPQITVDTFERLFINNTLDHNSPLSTENKLGQSFLAGSFHVGMRTPEITARIDGANVPANKVEITFRPSPAPARVFPQVETNGAWKQWNSLFAAQQWNIEVALNKSFDSLVYRKSRCIVDSFSMPGSMDRVMNEFYGIRKEKLPLASGKKYFYRITWSNPTDFDTNNIIHNNYGEFQTHMVQYQLDHNDSFNMDAGIDLIKNKRVNYKFSAIDSITVTDSVSTRDTAICGLACNFSMEGVSLTPVSGHVRVGDQVAVGKFTMKVKSITENTTNKTFSGTGSIACSMFAAPFAVTFTDIKINSEKRMVDGLVKAAYKSDEFISNITSSSTGNSLHDKIKNLIVRRSVAYSNSLVDETEDTVKTTVPENDPNAQELEVVYDYFSSPANILVDGLFNNEITLPFGLSKEVDNYPHTIAITDVNFTPTSANFNAAAIFTIDMPNLRQYMGFGASGLCLTPKGIGDVANGGALELMGSVKIPMGEGYGFLTILGRDLDTSGRFGNSGTRVMWSCKGFEGIDVKVSVDISRRVAFPVANNQKIKGRRVKATGHGMFNSANNWLISLDFDTSYQLTFLPGFTFKNRIVALDFSNLANPQGMAFPTEYQGDRSNTWQGIYIKELSVGLPPFLNEKDTLSMLSFGGRDILIDKTGFTGNIGVDNIISITDGSFGGWKFSMDHLGASFVNNMPRSSGFNGKIRVPLFGNDLNYAALLTAQMANEKLNRQDSIGVNFSLTNPGELSFDALFARLNIAPSSKIELLGNALVPKTLRIRTNFNGNISLGADAIAGMKDIRLGTLPFEGLKFKTAFFTLDSAEFKLDRLGGMDMNRLISETPPPSGTPAPAPVSSGEQKAGGFPINIQDFTLHGLTKRPCVFDLDRSYTGPRFGIKFKVMVNVADAMGNAIGGSCGLGLYMAIKPGNGFYGVQPIGLDVDTIKINATLTGAVSITGGIAFIANDPVYGNGIAGVVEAKTPVFSAGVTGMFGEINRMRYWMFGLKATFPPVPIDFSANVIYANSASGEFWYKMNRTSGSAADVAAGFQLGKSPSGASFVPDASQLFGFGIAMGITGPPGSPLFGDLGLYAQINTQGGLDKMTLEGNMWMTSNDKTTAPVFISGNTTVDVTNQKLVGMMSALVNAGGGAVRGRKTIASGGKTFYEAGSVDLLVDFKKQNWHIKLGNPFLANSKLGFGFYAGNTLLFESGGYFMMGNNLPQNLPPMDPGLVAKLEQARIVIPAQRESSASTGFVVLGGVDAKIPEKKIELGAFYAGLSVQFALDGMLRPQTINCQGRNGLQGWYMTGRAYAVINGALGIHADLPFFTGDITAAELNAGMLLDAGLMNPYFFKGQFAANYSVLGGFIEGSRQFDFELAEDDRCKPAISPRSTRFGAIVADVRPAAGATNVLVGVQPTIALNYPYNKETTFKSTRVVDGKNVTVEEKIRLQLGTLTLRDMSTGKLRRVRAIPSSDGLDLTIRPDSFLRDGRTNHILTAKFFVERFNKSTNAWEILKRTNGKNWDTTITLSFQTELQASFQASYVGYTTPREGERYFKRGDHTTGKIVCNQSNVQGTFFTGTLSATQPTRSIQIANGYNRYYGLYAKAGNPNDTVRVPLTFYSSEIHFPLLQNTDTNSLYQFRIIQERVPGQGLVNTGTNIYRDINGVRLRSRTASDVVDRRLIMYSFVFKTSKYSRMNDKITQLNLNTPAYTFATGSDITVICNTSEPFEAYELQSSPVIPTAAGNVTLPPGMAISCSNYSQDDNSWMINDYRPRVFRAGDTLQRRKSALASPFYDRTKQLAGADIIFNEHVLQPIPNSSSAFAHDLRLADNRILQLREQLLQASSLMLAGTDVSSLNLLADNGLSLDPVTGEVSGSTLTANPYSVSTSTTTTTTATPPIGSRLHINYTHFRLMASDFNRLKALANAIVSTNPTYWMIGMTTQERQLVTRVRRTDYTFRIPTQSNRFAISLHPRNNNTAPLKRLYINSTILDPIIVNQTNTTYTSFNRF